MGEGGGGAGGGATFFRSLHKAPIFFVRCRLSRNALEKTIKFHCSLNFLFGYVSLPLS